MPAGALRTRQQQSTVSITHGTVSIAKSLCGQKDVIRVVPSPHNLYTLQSCAFNATHGPHAKLPVIRGCSYMADWE